MSKKIILLALAAASLAAFALPAMAMAEDVPVHAVGVELNKPQTIDGEGVPTLTATFGNIECTASHGSATFTNSTTGTFEQTFTGCTEPFHGKCTTPAEPALPEGTITTTNLQFHLLTVEDSETKLTGAGVLVTPNGGHFATFKCPIIGKQEFTGTGLVGTIKSPDCSGFSKEATLEFSSATKGEQTHRTVVGTETEYELKSGGQRASEDASDIITFTNEPTLQCT